MSLLSLFAWFAFLLICFFGFLWLCIAAFASSDRKIAGRKPWVEDETHRSASVTRIGGRFSNHPEDAA